ncbi:MAG: small multi-drug export protein [Methanoregula sp.]|nr:small multi-drug export protein [Methanoregula sp.]
MGLVFFVMFPLRGTGGIGGFIVGRMLGMTKKDVLLAFTLGAFIGCFAIAGGSLYILGVIRQDLMTGRMLIIIVAAVLLLSSYGYRYYHNMQKNRMEFKKNNSLLTLFLRSQLLSGPVVCNLR